MRRRSAKDLKVAAVAAVCMSLGALTACGSGDDPLSTVRSETAKETSSHLDEPVKNEELPVAELVRRAKQASAAIETVHVVADVASDGKRFRFDLRIDRDTEDFTGTIAQDDIELDTRRIGNDMYVRGDEKAYRSLLGEQGDGIVPGLLAGKWLKDDADGSNFRSLEGITSVADPGAILEDFPDDGVKLPTETIDGRRMIPLTGPPGEDEAKVYIEAQGGKPYPVMVISNDSDSGGTVSYGDFDAPVDVEAPSPDDVITVPKKGGSPSPGTPGSSTPRPSTPRPSTSGSGATA